MTPRNKPALPWSGTRQRLATLGFVTLLLVIAPLLLYGQTLARRQLEDRFGQRIVLAGNFIDTYVSDILAREAVVASHDLAGATVRQAELEQAMRAFGFQSAVILDSSGAVLRVAPASQPGLGENLAATYPYLQAALGGTPTVSGVVSRGELASPTVGFAAPYDTPFGRRVLSGAFDVSTTPLSAFLGNAIGSTTMVYLIDPTGAVVASNLSASEHPAMLSDADPDLALAIAGVDKGNYRRAGVDGHFTVQPIAGTPFREVATISTTDLYALVTGPVWWVPWGVFAGLFFVGMYLLRVLSVLSRSQRQLRAVGEELERSNRELQDFATVASHDLQEPLRKIQAFGDRLAQRSADTLDNENQDYLRRMMNAAARMKSLINDLLEYSRVTMQPGPAQPVDLGQVVAEVLSDLDERIRDSNGQVHVGPLPTVFASPVQMRQLFQNLIANALKFHPNGVAPDVHIEATTDGTGWGDRDPMWEIRVRDNGIGFQEKHAERIFAPFQRLNANMAYEGTGMGLAICRRIVAQGGGTIVATSQPGAGSSFLITLPRTEMPLDDVAAAA